jgi:hypothetical protein
LETAQTTAVESRANGEWCYLASYSVINRWIDGNSPGANTNVEGKGLDKVPNPKIQSSSTTDIDIEFEKAAVILSRKSLI